MKNYTPGRKPEQTGGFCGTRSVLRCATYRGLSGSVGSLFTLGSRIEETSSLWAAVPVEGDRGAHLSFRHQGQAVVRRTSNRYVFILSDFRFVAAHHRSGAANLLASRVHGRNLFQNFRDRLRRHEGNIFLRIDERLGRFNQYLAGQMVRTVLNCETNAGPRYETF
jgi:hypothetical protein